MHSLHEWIVPWTVPSADPEGGDRGSGLPPENHKLYIFYKNKQLEPPTPEKVGPPPLENVGPPQEP